MGESNVQVWLSSRNYSACPFFNFRCHVQKFTADMTISMFLGPKVGWRK
jgi:hypothetical protein